jgi:hypothetical protein
MSLINATRYLDNNKPTTPTIEVTGSATINTGTSTVTIKGLVPDSSGNLNITGQYLINGETVIVPPPTITTLPQLGIGTPASADYTLDISGNINTNGQYLVDGIDVTSIATEQIMSNVQMGITSKSIWAFGEDTFNNNMEGGNLHVVGLTELMRDPSHGVCLTVIGSTNMTLDASLGNALTIDGNINVTGQYLKNGVAFTGTGGGGGSTFDASAVSSLPNLTTVGKLGTLDVSGNITARGGVTLYSGTGITPSTGQLGYTITYYPPQTFINNTTTVAIGTGITVGPGVWLLLAQIGLTSVSGSWTANIWECWFNDASGIFAKRQCNISEACGSWGNSWRGTTAVYTNTTSSKTINFYINQNLTAGLNNACNSTNPVYSFMTATRIG